MGATDSTKLATYDASIGDTVLWDDLRTATVETRDERVLRAFVAALELLETQLGPDMAEWRWGRLHTLRLGTIVPQPGEDVLSIPTPRDAMFADGWPRHGDNFTVDVGNFGTAGGTRFTYGAGPQQRLVVELGPDGPIARNALPGGESEDPDSPHHADEAEHWRRNEAPPIYFAEPDVVSHAETRTTFSPASP